MEQYVTRQIYEGKIQYIRNVKLDYRVTVDMMPLPRQSVPFSKLHAQYFSE